MAESTTIGPYRVLEPLGRGGMGIVYRARHTNSERPIALKTVDVPATKWIDSIRREIQALTRIRHPGIVRIVDHGVHQGRPWYAMDLVEGESLRSFGQRLWSPYRRLATPVPSTEQLSITEEVSGEWAAPGADGSGTHPVLAAGIIGRPPAAAGDLNSVLQMMRRICATLAFLHGEGFLNCDLKPENVLLVGDQPVIIDFGLTTHHPGGSGREALEAQRGLSGTLPYMSPEQIRAEFLDARSDLYSVGCMLYELVTGAPPFTGPPRVIIKQHLTAAPARPSELVADVSADLERLILKLLEKELTHRYGYADEVAAELAELSQDARRLSDYPPSRSYLYRPRFVGRDAIIAQLSSVRERTMSGSGSLVIIAGESGVGKTRLAMELTRFGPIAHMRVVTSEASALAVESAAAVAPAPLHALRSLLQAVADRCQEAGPEETELLLGHRRSVLALYEPLLAHVPANEPLPPIMPLSAEASRQRLFKYLSETIAAFVHEQPLMWVLDDLGWADELSLTFLKSLSAEYLDSHAIFILGAYRTEEPSEAIAEIAQLSHVTHIELPRLEPAAVHDMIRDMLALREPLDGFTDFVSGQAEGNPFFVGEYLRTAVAERLLHRDQRLNWQLDADSGGQAPQYQSLGLPRSLLALIEHRLRKLSPAAQQVGLAAAVLGRESDVDTLREVADIEADSSASAIDELLRRQILEQPQADSVRFAHDKLREVTYSQAPTAQVRELHSRAAVALENRSQSEPDSKRCWATLGHHYAAAHQPEKAAHYLKLAADHAKETHANTEAIRLYREAINQVNQILLRLTSEPAEWQETLIGLYEALGDVLALGGQRDEGRSTFEVALRQAEDGDPELQARLFRKIGKTWETQHQHGEALRYYELGKNTLQVEPLSVPAEQRNEWIQVRVEQLWVYYWLARIDEMSAIANELQPLVESYGTQAQRVRFFETQMMYNIRRDRYVVTEQTLKFARSALDACRGREEMPELPVAQFGYGFALLHHHSLEAAAIELRAAVQLARRAGDAAQQARCLAYLTLANRMLHRAEETRLLTGQLTVVAEVAGTMDYLGTARAHEAWLSLQQREATTAKGLALQAIGIWNDLKTYTFPFQWLARLPLLEVDTQLGNLEEAIAGIEPLLAPSQQFLPGAATDSLVHARERWNIGDSNGASNSLNLALTQLRERNYR